MVTSRPPIGTKVSNNYYKPVSGGCVSWATARIHNLLILLSHIVSFSQKLNNDLKDPTGPHSTCHFYLVTDAWRFLEASKHLY